MSLQRNIYFPLSDVQSVHCTLQSYYTTELIASSNDPITQKSPRLGLAVGIYFIARCKHSYTCEESKKNPPRGTSCRISHFQEHRYYRNTFFCLFLFSQVKLLHVVSKDHNSGRELSGKEAGEQLRELELDCESQKQQQK